MLFAFHMRHAGDYLFLSISLLSISNCDDRGIAMDDRNTEQVVNLANEQHRRAFILVRYCKDITE